VRDNGHGMDEATQARIFDPFFSTKFTGRGLGLSAVLGIVRGHEGLLTVNSRPGVGTTFKVYFPITGSQRIAPSPAEAAVARGSGTVLVVDDEELVRTTARVALSKAGYHVLTAVDGADGVRMFAAYADEIDLVLLDMTMPVMGGEEAVLRMRELRPNAVVLASSGYDEREAQQRFGASIAGFLQKPYTASQLTAKVGKLMRSRAQN
jgi:CheY-like chemotaxis protein